MKREREWEGRSGGKSSTPPKRKKKRKRRTTTPNDPGLSLVRGPFPVCTGGGSTGERARALMLAFCFLGRGLHENWRRRGNTFGRKWRSHTRKGGKKEGGAVTEARTREIKMGRIARHAGKGSRRWSAWGGQAFGVSSGKPKMGRGMEGFEGGRWKVYSQKRAAREKIGVEWLGRRLKGGAGQVRRPGRHTVGRGQAGSVFGEKSNMGQGQR